MAGIDVIRFRKDVPKVPELPVVVENADGFVGIASSGVQVGVFWSGRNNHGSNGVMIGFRRIMILTIWDPSPFIMILFSEDIFKYSVVC